MPKTYLFYVPLTNPVAESQPKLVKKLYTEVIWKLYESYMKGIHRSYIYESYMKSYTQKLYTEVIHRSYIQKLYTEVIHKSYTQKLYTKVIHKSYTQKLYIWKLYESYVKVIHRSYMKEPPTSLIMSINIKITVANAPTKVRLMRFFVAYFCVKHVLFFDIKLHTKAPKHFLQLKS